MSAIVHEPWCTNHQHDDADPATHREEVDICEAHLLKGRDVQVGVNLDGADGEEQRVPVVDLYTQSAALTPQRARETAAALLRAADIVEAAETGDGAGDDLINDRPDEPYERQDDCPSWCRAHLYENGSFGEPVTLHRAVIAHGELDDHVAINQGIGMTWGNSGVPGNQPTLEVEGFIWVDAAGTRDLISALQTGLRLLEADW